MRKPDRQRLGYLAVLAASFLLALVAGWLGTPIDNYAYDWMFRHQPAAAWEPQSALLVADEASLTELGGMRGLRGALARALEHTAAAGPKAVAIDIVLAEEGDAADDAALEAALAKTSNLALSCELLPGERWQLPIERFRRRAAALGHIHGDPGPLDGVSRVAPLEKAGARQRYWALALEAFRLSQGEAQIEESPQDLRVGATLIPAIREHSRALRIRYLPPAGEGLSAVPRLTFKQLHDHPGLAARFRGKTVFVGITAQSAARDRLLTPYSHGFYMAGVEIHANVFETLARGRFLVPAPEAAAVALCLGLAAAGVLIFVLRAGWQAYALAGLLLVAAHVLPYVFFLRDLVFPYFAPVSSAWLATVSAGAYQFVTVRRRLRRAEAERARYQEAVHFVSHEMRTPLTAIQGSSDLMRRYKLSEDKRQEIAERISSESRRLARMIETFLSVERLSAGEMELKQEVFPARELVEACIERARPLAERKQIRIDTEPLAEALLTGDRELMEYAVYNLLTNAVKYSPPETLVTVRSNRDDGRLRISVQDQGIGMDQDEVKKVFQKFYRTRRAEASGEKGTGIGLSIVEQIVTHHGGNIEVTSQPERGSCFTLVLPAQVASRAGSE
ncbi:MAG: CHASE2 domain-containing protein [Acidobacteria bacterium]|nr:CHASE2 domain-containing protein [Acidobacteriota bacterium]